MSEHDSEREIARLFQAQREADETIAPPFREIVQRPPRRGRSVRPFRLVAGTAGALAVAALALLLHRAPPPAAPSDGAALAAWKAPSDVLLQTPGSELLNQTPTLASPIPESLRTLPAHSKGGQG